MIRIHLKPRIAVEASERYCEDCHLLTWEMCPTPHCVLFYPEHQGEDMAREYDKYDMEHIVRWPECLKAEVEP